MSTRGLLIRLASTIQLRLMVSFGLIQCGHRHHIIECNLFSPWYSWNVYHFGVKWQSLTHSGTLSFLHIYRKCWHILKNNKCIHLWYFVDIASASKINFARWNETALGSWGQAVTSLKIDWGFELKIPPPPPIKFKRPWLFKLWRLSEIRGSLLGSSVPGPMYWLNHPLIGPGHS